MKTGLEEKLKLNRSVLLVALSLSIGGLVNIEMILSPYITALGGSLLAVGSLYSIRGVIGLVFRLPMGLLSDRLGRKPLLLFCSGLRSIGSLILALASKVNDVLYGLVARSLANISENPAYFAAIGDLVEEGSIGIVFGLALSMRHIPSMISPLITGFVADLAGLRAVFMVSMILYAASLLLIMIFVSEPRREFTGGYGFSFLLKDRRLLLLFAAFLLVFSAQTAFTPFFNILAVDYVGLSFSQLGLITSLGAATGLAARIFSGWLSDRLSPKAELILAGVLRAFSFILAAYAGGFPLLLLAYLANRLLMFAPARNTIIVRLTPSEFRGRAFALMGLAADLGEILGATAAGLAAEFYGIEYSFYLMALMVLTFTLLISKAKL